MVRYLKNTILIFYMIITSAPGKIILFGERAVVYNKLAISCAVNLRTKVNIKESKRGKIFSSYGMWTYNKKEIISVRKRYDKIISNEEYSKLRNYEIGHPIRYLLSKLFDDIGYKNLNVIINSKVPKGTGSSSSLACALVFGIYKLFNYKITKKKIIDMSIYFDKIAHGGAPSGIDVATSTYGGFIAFKKNEGAKKLNINFDIPILIVDTEVPSRSSITADSVRYLLKKNFKKTNNTLNAINSISHEAIDYLKNNNKEKLGKLMNKNQILLKNLELSKKEIDKLINYIRKKHNIYGAKLTGGGGGGSIIILAEDYSKMIPDLSKKGFKNYLIRTGVDGVRKEQ